MNGSALGPQTILVIPCNAMSKPEQPYTVAELQAMFAPDGEVNRAWAAMSYGALGPFNATVMPYQTMDDLAAPLPYNCSDLGGPMWGYAYNSLKALMGTSFLTFSKQLWTFPTLNCGTNGNAGPGTVQVQGRFGLRTLFHEFGHAMGLAHARGETCSNGAMTPACAVSETGDIFDFMGALGGDFSALEKKRMGWIDTPNRPRIQVVPQGQSGDYVIEPYETPRTSTGVVAVRVPAPTGSNLSVVIEARGDERRFGVMFRSDLGAYTLLDLGGGSYSFTNPGQTYYHPVVKARFTVVSFSREMGAVLNIRFDSALSTPVSSPTNLRAL